MSLNSKPIDFITFDDLQSLVNRKIPEGKSLEYKQDLPSRGEEHCKEFLKDVSSFANSSGGLLIFGIKQAEGEPTEVCGVRSENLDNEILRLENLIRDGVEPRIPGISIRAIVEQSKAVVLIRIPRSWACPHVVAYKGRWRFYSRNSAGVYPLDVGELRNIFNMSEVVSRRIRDFRLERLSLITAKETPVFFRDGALTVLHIIPIDAFVPSRAIDLRDMETSKYANWKHPISARGSTGRHNFDGYLVTSQVGSDEWPTYLQIFRNGCIESVDSWILNSANKKKIIPPKNFEDELIRSVQKYLNLLNALGSTHPLIIMLSLLGVKGYRMAPSQYHFGEHYTIVHYRTFFAASFQPMLAGSRKTCSII